MADLNIPNLNIKTDKYIFKKKLNLRRKSKRRLFTESFFLFILSLLLVYINYLIPNKNLLLQNLPSTLNKSFLLLIDLFSYLYEIFLVIFIFTFGDSFNWSKQFMVSESNELPIFKTKGFTFGLELLRTKVCMWRWSAFISMNYDLYIGISLLIKRFE